MKDKDKTLEEIDNERWEAPSNATGLVETVHRLRKKPLKDFSIEDLRIMIGQECNLDQLIPMAIRELNNNILAEGNHYPGDLLYAVLETSPVFWQQHPQHYAEIARIAKPWFDKTNGQGEYRSIIKSYQAFVLYEVSK